MRGSQQAWLSPATSTLGPTRKKLTTGSLLCLLVLALEGARTSAHAVGCASLSAGGKSVHAAQNEDVIVLNVASRQVLEGTRSTPPAGAIAR